jgi:hypothetical protein
VDTNSIVALLARFDARRAPAALLRLLGFAAPLRPVTPPRGMPARVRSLRTTRRTTLAAYVLCLRGPCTDELVRAAVRMLRTFDALGHQVLLFVEPRAARVVIACDALHDGVRSLGFAPGRVRASDVEALAELLPRPDESDTAAALRITRALDRSRVTARFFRDVTAARDLVARCWTGLPKGEDAGADRDALALLLLSRLLFLYFLQRRGLLAGDADYLPHLLREHRRSRPRASFHATTLHALFFGALNRRRERRSARALALGDLPYLNGGLFERHALERRRPDLDLPDDALARVIDDLLEKYRFTAAPAAGGIDPEMLGRIFEGLMPGDRRARTGTFYTPADVVERVVRETLTEHLRAACAVPADIVASLLAEDGAGAAHAATRVERAAERLRVLDPACGSGAFLLGALGMLARLRAGRHGAIGDAAARRAVVADSLYGIDLLGDAALICSLRLWLSLVPACETVADVPPLPNLDRRIRQGDALIDPLDIAAPAAPRAVRPLLRALAPTASDYLNAGPETRTSLRRRLDRLERQLARGWQDALDADVRRQTRELEARAADRDLFGTPAPHAHAAMRTLPALRRREAELNAFRDDITSSRSLPFFSYRVHFAKAEDGFDVILSNPPWVRSHNWPPTVRETLRERYAVCAEAGWPYAARLAGSPHAAGAQVDLSLLFLERGVRLLAPGGTLGMLLPAKLIRSLYAGGARALLLRDTRLVAIEDHSLDQRAIFDADAFTAVVIARRPDAAPDTSSQAAPGGGGGAVRVRVTRPDRDELRFELPTAELPLRPGDPNAPWLLAPPGCTAALRAMQCAAPGIAEHGLPVRRGAMTGANDVMLVRAVDPKIGDLARIRAEGWYRTAGGRRRAYAGLVEASTLRPALRGTDIQRWSAAASRHVIWSAANDAPDGATADRTPHPRLDRFLRRHADRLRQPPERLGALQRLNEHTLGHKVVWPDLAADLRAAAVLPCARSAAGLELPVVPLNTVYFIATTSHAESLLLSAYLNSLPLRTFARAIAERAKDAHFRFFAWTVGVLPLPRDWRDNRAAGELTAIAATAHRDGRLARADRERLDAAVTAVYGLTSDHLDAIAAFDAWLSGRAGGEDA